MIIGTTYCVNFLDDESLIIKKFFIYNYLLPPTTTCWNVMLWNFVNKINDIVEGEKVRPLNLSRDIHTKNYTNISLSFSTFNTDYHTDH